MIVYRWVHYTLGMSVIHVYPLEPTQKPNNEPTDNKKGTKHNTTNS
jgi:hypothetical protein